MTSSATVTASETVGATGWQVAEPTGPTALDNSPDKTPARAASSAPKAASGDVGVALRNAFRATVDEDIPNEMLDLLRRLD
ncbi:hypothetical protein [Sphingomonas sp. SUN039]|uniref:hypothetical protein n=1 Tax=Sphingomonas sp. SUN039 TaxID=2937787 RepID=UPI0021648049|nr:hypothetical protein [Sphingomonas sp. SUN039]UVO54448.1 hypothetical protein M0209_10055 [Sphingomonas sp. SUN039]